MSDGSSLGEMTDKLTYSIDGYLLDYQSFLIITIVNEKKICKVAIKCRHIKLFI